MFIIYLKVKFNNATPPVYWLSVFFYIKLVTDLYGILNYTSWISTLITHPVLDGYRTTMGALDIAMLTSILLMTVSIRNKPKWHWTIFYLPSVLLLLISIFLRYQIQSNLIEVFDFVKASWIIIGSIIIFYTRSRLMKVFLLFVVASNTIWLSEVVLHEQMSLIPEDVSWIMFILSELILTIGLAQLLIQIVSKPNSLRFENHGSTLPSSLIAAIEKKLSEVFEQKKAFTDSNMTATSLASDLNLLPTDLTTYLNRIKKQNFNQFITSYRLNESKRLLKDTSEELTIEQVMFKSGFHSKSVFNTAFKESTGMTPTQFKKEKT